MIPNEFPYEAELIYKGHHVTLGVSPIIVALPPRDQHRLLKEYAFYAFQLSVFIKDIETLQKEIAEVFKTKKDAFLMSQICLVYIEGIPDSVNKVKLVQIKESRNE
jgi:hypothetical protein